MQALFWVFLFPLLSLGFRFSVNFKSLFFSVPISLICGITLYFLFSFFTPPEFRAPSNGYAVLSFDESENDRQIQEILFRAGMEGFISESSQKILLDDFGSLKTCQLDSFYAEIEEYDPRNDGYAGKLKNFFVHGGKRFFFIPLEEIRSQRSLNKKLNSIFTGISYSFAVLGPERSFFLYFFLLASASVCALLLSQARRQFLFLVPVLAAMGWGGPSAIVPAAVLYGIWELLREPFRELSITRRGKIGYAGRGIKGVLERLKPYKFNFFLSAHFLLFFSAFSFLTGLAPVPAAASAVFFFFLLFISFQSEKELARKNQHIRFTPVLIFPRKVKTFSFFPSLLPFAVISLVALFLPQTFATRRENTALVDLGFFVTRDDYSKHVAFQRSFSYRPLNQPEYTQEGYLRYYLGSDGLIAGRDVVESLQKESLSLSAEFPPEIPPFPLEKLMEFLINYHKHAVIKTAGETELLLREHRPVLPGNLEEWISVGIILMMCIVDLIKRGILASKRLPALRDKRAAA